MHKTKHTFLLCRVEWEISTKIVDDDSKSLTKISPASSKAEESASIRTVAD
jgi:hypothetical protein